MKKTITATAAATVAGNAQPAEQESPLDALAAAAGDLAAPPGGDATDLDVAEANGQGQAPPGPGNAEVIADVIGLARDTINTLTGLKSTERTLAPDKVAQLAAMWGRVADKHGINLHETVGDWMPEFMACVTTFAIFKPVVAEFRAEVAQLKEKEKLAKAQPLQVVPKAAPAVAPIAPLAPLYTPPGDGAQ